MAKKIQLKNGMQVLLLENKKSPVISVQMWVKTGSADEKKGEEGISHFIEHLVFKGTQKYGVGEIASIIEGSGGELNAYTSFDQTVFYVTISKEFSETALDTISQMMGFPKFDPTEIDNEREVVIEEIKRGNDSLGRRASQLLFSTAYQKHPYGIPVIGYEKNIRKVSRETLLDYYHRRYVPENMLLVVAGDFESSEMRKKVKQYFESFEPYRLKKISREKEPQQLRPRIKVEKTDFEETQIYFSWRTPTVTHKDIPALDVLAMIFGQGESSRLVRKLRIDEPIVNSVGSSCYSPKDKGLFLVSMGLNPQGIDKALNKLQEETQRLLVEEPSIDELQRAITMLESDEYYGLETVEGMARKAGTLEFLFNDHTYFKEYMKSIYELTPSSLRKVAKKYLKPDQIIVTAVTNTDEKVLTGKIRDWVKEYKKFFEKKPSISSRSTELKAPVKKMKWSFTQNLNQAPEIEEVKLPSGVNLILWQAEGTPVISLKGVFRGGLREEDKSKLGLSEIFARTWVSGTTKHSEEELIHKIENIAGGLSGFAGRNTVGLSLDLLKPFEREGADLFAEVLTDSVWPEHIIEREKLVQREQIRSRKDSPAQLAILAFMKTLFGEHPYAESILGEENTVNSIQHSDVVSYWKRVGGRENLNLSLSGNFDRKLWLDKLSAMTEKLPKGESLTQNFTHKSPDEKEIRFHELKKEQSHIVYGYKGLTFTDEDRFNLQVMQSILAGQGGRLFIELRDKASLAYSVSPLRMEGIDTGYFGAYIGCSPEKAGTAIRMMEEQFVKLCEENASDIEIERAIRYIIGRHDIELQRTSSVNSSLLFNKVYGIAPQETFEVAERFREVTPASVREVANKIFKQKPVISIVGPTNPF